MAIAALTQLIPLSVTLSSILRLTQSSHQIPDHVHFMDDLSPQIFVYLPKLTTVSSHPPLFVIDAHLVPLSTSRSQSLRALGVCMPVPLVLTCALHSILPHISILHKPNLYADTYSRAPLPRNPPRWTSPSSYPLLSLHISVGHLCFCISVCLLMASCTPIYS